MTSEPELFPLHVQPKSVHAPVRDRTQMNAESRLAGSEDPRLVATGSLDPRVHTLRLHVTSDRTGPEPTLPEGRRESRQSLVNGKVDPPPLIIHMDI